MSGWVGDHKLETLMSISKISTKIFQKFDFWTSKNRFFTEKLNLGTRKMESTSKIGLEIMFVIWKMWFFKKLAIFRPKIAIFGQKLDLKIKFQRVYPGNNVLKP